jgi:hypothetical protein
MRTLPDFLFNNENRALDSHNCKQPILERNTIVNIMGNQ